jgi:hypothetical protein
MFPVPESNWMGNFAISVAVGHRVGTARGDRAVLSAMEIGRDELMAQFGRSINQLILAHRNHLNRKRKLPISSEPKSRWVDGTPEYSVHIFGLRKLFPEALFIHIVRDARDVVRSMLNFHRLAGTPLVANEEHAYKYWLRTVKGCVEAEQAFGPRVVLRLSYQQLINDSEAAMRTLLDFVGEPYERECLEPLAQRMNSSNVPADFVSEDPATDRAIVDEAATLSAQLLTTPQPAEATLNAGEQMEREFEQRVEYTTTLDQAYRDCRRKLKEIGALG